MFKNIKKLFSTDASNEEQENQDILNDKNMAIAVLLVEAAHMDGDFTDDEKKPLKKF